MNEKESDAIDVILGMIGKRYFYKKHTGVLSKIEIRDKTILSRFISDNGSVLFCDLVDLEDED